MIPLGIDPCPEDDPDHDRYHRRVSLTHKATRASAWVVACSATIFALTFPVTLWVADWDGVRRSCVSLFVAVVFGLLVKLLGDVQSYLYKAEMIRLAREATSVSAAAEKLLRQDGTAEGGYA